MIVADADIVYTIRVTNNFTRPLTGLTIWDVIPVGARVVDLGGGSTTMPPLQMIQWQAPVLNAQDSLTRNFTVRLLVNSGEIRNELYFVDVMENGALVMRAVGAEPVVTTILPSSPLDYLSLPTATTNLTDTLIITNVGATVKWEYTSISSQMTSGPAYNAPFHLYLPFAPVVRGQSNR
jgi:hypothetical protein